MIVKSDVISICNLAIQILYIVRVDFARKTKKHILKKH